MYRGADKSLARLGRNKLQRQKILMFIYPMYYHNWRNISTIYIYITRLASNEIFSPSNKIHREVGRTKDLSAPLYCIQAYRINYVPYSVFARVCCETIFTDGQLGVTSKCTVTKDVRCRRHTKCNDTPFLETLTYHKVRTFISENISRLR
jgi:hypothetical protein